MVKDIRPQLQMDNAAILNAIRNDGNLEYRARVPEATQANITEVVNSLWSVPALRNQFIDALVNRIGMVIYRSLSWSNPLAKFKYGILEFGETIEEIQAGLLTASSYDADRDELEKEIFGAMRPDVQASYHRIDRADRYKLTVKEPDLRKAFINPNGLGTFITNLMAMLQNSDQVDEYKIMVNLFAEYDKAAGENGFFTQKVSDLSNLDVDDSIGARAMLKALQKFGNTLPFVSTLYNPAGMPTAVSPDKLELFVTASAEAAMNVDALAGAFNISKAEFASRRTILPDYDFGIDGVQAILTTRDFFVCADSLIDTTSQFNPATLANNYWLHHRGVYSVSRFAPAIMFSSTRESTVVTRDETPVTGIGTITVNVQNDDKSWTSVTSVERNHIYNVFANANTTPAGGPNDSVMYAVIGNGSTIYPISQFTSINNYGDLKIGPDEQNSSLSIVARSVDDNSFTTATSVTVKGDMMILWPDPEVIPDSDDDGLNEVTPDKPDFTNNVITIPNQRGVQYKNGATALNNGSTVNVASGTPVTITAVARPNYELATGATASWTFTYVAP